MFGKDFTRTEENSINAALNYGYGIILSTFNREIVSNGYITQIGLFHDNMFNQFNLASDLMEPFRVLIDREVIQMQRKEFTHEEKIQLVNVLTAERIHLSSGARSEIAGFVTSIPSKFIIMKRDAFHTLLAKLRDASTRSQ